MIRAIADIVEAARAAADKDGWTNTAGVVSDREIRALADVGLLMDWVSNGSGASSIRVVPGSQTQVAGLGAS